ncbi:hypothetical protein A2U01_0088331, partial [Trifolium medium]|nr:hypothetical protein [Trifolium medium]
QALRPPIPPLGEAGSGESGPPTRITSTNSLASSPPVKRKILLRKLGVPLLLIAASSKWASGP